jgi:hypothetical protein
MTKDRFYQFVMIYLFEHNKADASILKIILDSFFESLTPGPVKLETVDNIIMKDGNLEIVIHGLYSAHPTRYTVVLDKELNVKNLFVL